MYQVLERHLKDELQERTPLKAERLVIHSTANPGVGDENHFKWLDSKRQHGWAHYYLDWDSISQVVPEGLVAPANGPTANKNSLSIELCEPAELPWSESTANFQKVWDRGVWLSADILHRYRWGTEAVVSHAQISRMYPKETNHMDPLAFFSKYGKTWDDFLKAVDSTLYVLQNALPPAADWKTAYMDRAMRSGLLSTRRHPNQPVIWWELLAMLERR